MSVLVTLFSDFTCPFSYVTETGLRRAVKGNERISVDYRAMEVYPAPVEPVAPAREDGWEAAVLPLAERLGVPLQIPNFRPRTRKAHEAARFTASRGVGSAMRDAIFRAYWAEGRDIGRIDVLMELSANLGLDPIDLKIALDIDRFEDAVIHDLHTARRLRVPGTPTLYIGTGVDARVLIGAQSPEALDQVIRGG